MPRTVMRRPLVHLIGLVVLSCLIQGLLVGRAVLTSLDTVGFVRAARQIDVEGFAAVVGQHSQPLYPVAVWAAHRGLSACGFERESLWALSAQIVAAAALVLCVIPVYGLSCRLVGPAAAWAGSLFFVLLPEVARLGADGLSDSTHLLWFCLALWAIVEFLAARPAVGRCSVPQGQRSLFAAGLAVGVALLARAEAVVLPMALAGYAVAVVAGRRQRCVLAQTASSAAAFALGFVLVWAPYLAATHSLSPARAADRLLGRPIGPQPSGGEAEAVWAAQAGMPLSFDSRDGSTSIRRRGWADGSYEFADELLAVFGYWVGPLALVGTAWLWRRAVRPVDCFVAGLFALYATLTFVFSVREGYLDARHLVPLVVLGSGTAGLGAMALGSLMARPLASPRLRAAAPWVAVAAAALPGAARWSEPLHASHAGHRKAAAWLAESIVAGGVIDTRGWTGLYSGRATWPFEEAALHLGTNDTAYAVLEDSEIAGTTNRAQTLRWLVGPAKPAAAFASRGRRGSGGVRVLIYRLSPARCQSSRPDVHQLVRGLPCGN